MPRKIGSFRSMEGLYMSLSQADKDLIEFAANAIKANYIGRKYYQYDPSNGNCNVKEECLMKSSKTI